MTACLLRGFIAVSVFAASAFGQVRMPEQNPPFVSGPNRDDVRPSELAPLPAIEPMALTEWTLHMTSDGSHPSGSEQQMVWLMNRARRAPSIEGIWLAHLRQVNVQSAMNYFGVLRNVLMDEFAARSSTAPGAFDARLYLAASNHSAYLISIDGQNHSNQFQRIADQGFHYSSGRGSVYSYSKDAIHGHAGFNVDWGGDDGTGMQEGRGHREGVMGDYSCVGIACVVETNPATSVGPLVTTINYCNALSGYSDHYNRFIVGTVWTDSNTNDLYDPGEGMGNVTVMPDQGTYYAVTGIAGGYAIPASAGTYTVTFSGGGLSSNVLKQVVVGSVSALVDLELSIQAMDMRASPTISPEGMLTYTLTGQRKGCAYSLVTTTNLLFGDWIWTGVLPIGYDDTLTYNAQLIETNLTQRFIALRGWRY